MTFYLLDANHLSPLLNLQDLLRKAILFRLSRHDQFFVPVPALAEFWFGLYQTARVAENKKTWRATEGYFKYIEANRTDAHDSARLRWPLRRKGFQLKYAVSLIAAVAIRNDFVLLTSDKDFAPVPGLKTENWRV